MTSQLRALLLFAAASPLLRAQSGTLAGVSLGVNANLNGWRPFPANSFWNQTVTGAAADNSNAGWKNEMGAVNIFVNFAGTPYGPGGIPYNVVDSSVTPLVNVPILLYGDNSDLASIPYPPNLAIEDSPGDCYVDWRQGFTGAPSDNHANILDRATGFLYELWQAEPCKGSKFASTETVWNTAIDQRRPYGYTSVDAAGMSVFAGLVKYEEATTQTCAQQLNGVTVQAVCHKIRITMLHLHNDDPGNGYYQPRFIDPATHGASNGGGGTYNYPGMVLRLRADYDVSRFTGEALPIVRAMQTYGFVIVDIGRDGSFQGTPDLRWNDNTLGQLQSIKLGDFDVIAYDHGTIYSADIHPTGTLPTVSTPTVAASTIVRGQSTTLSATATGASYTYVQGGPFSASASTVNATVAPVNSTTYNVVSSNQFGRTVSTPIPITVLVPTFQGTVAIGARP